MELKQKKIKLNPNNGNKLDSSKVTGPSEKIVKVLTLDFIKQACCNWDSHLKSSNLVYVQSKLIQVILG